MKYFLSTFLFGTISLWSQSNCENGEILFKQKKYVEAQALLQKCISENPKNYKAIDQLGEIAYHNKNWDDAIKYSTILKNAYPTNAEYWFRYGGSLGMKAKISSKMKALMLLDDVEGAFIKATKLDSKHINSRWALVVLYVELPGIIGGSESKALRYANELMQLSKVDGYLAKGYIDVYFERYDKAEINYKKAYEIGQSKTTFEKLYDLYLNKLQNKTKAEEFKRTNK